MTPDINKDQLFIVCRGRLPERWDPGMALYVMETTFFVWEIKKLRDVLIRRPQYGANERSIERNTLDEPRYIRITDIDNFGRLKEELGVTAEVIERKYILSDGDLLLARSGNTVGKAYLHQSAKVAYEAFFAGYMIRFKINRNIVSPQFIFIMTQLKFYKRWVSATQRATGQPNINAEEYKNLLLPIPDAKTQAKLVNIYESGLELLNQYQSKAQDLLDSIDDYLLAELGIKPPTTPEDTIESRMFYGSRRELTGWRFDPHALHPEREASIDAIRHVHEVKKLREVAKFSRIVFKDIPDDCPYIGLENVESNTGRYIYTDEKEMVSSAFFFKKGQILFPKLRPYLNKVFLAPFDGICSTEFHVIDSFSVNNDFLAIFLRSQLIVKQTKHLMSGNTLPRLQTQEIEELLVPIIDTSLQRKISKAVYDRQEQAEHLRCKAEEVLEQAKSKIENMMISGGEI